MNLKHTQRCQQRGMSLIEILVAMAIGLLLMVGVLQVFSAMRQSFKLQEALSNVQENARFAVDFISKDLRMAGYMGCMQQISEGGRIVNVVSGSNNWWFNASLGLRGYDGTETGIPTGIGPIVNQADAFVVNYLYDGNYVITQHNVSAAQIKTNENNDFLSGEILAATDCTNTAIFQMTGPNSNKVGDLYKSQEVVHNTGSSVTPGNCSKYFDFDTSTPCSVSNCASGNCYSFKGGFIYRLASYSYYIAADASHANEPTLYRRQLAMTSSGVSGLDTAQALVAGVENMQLLYGVDTNADQQADIYQQARDITAANWPRVVSVRLDLLVRSSEPNVLPEAQTITFNGETKSYSDRRLRKTFSTTIGIRNRLP